MINDAVDAVPEASGVETGAVELSRLYALRACVELSTNLGIDNIHRRVLDINGKLIEGLLS